MTSIAHLALEPPDTFAPPPDERTQPTSVLLMRMLQEFLVSLASFIGRLCLHEDSPKPLC